jgi:nucleotide-binding universal stress UspA family protein
VVVGADGSAEGELAVRLGAHEACLRGTELHLVHAAQSHLIDAEHPATGPLPDAVRLARAVVGDRVVVRALARTGPADRVLLDAGRDAALVVTGSHARNLITERVFGSVTHRLIARSAAPVLLVHTWGAALMPGAPVVFGATDTEADEPGHTFALTEAKLRGATLIVADATHGQGVIDAADGAGLLVLGRPPSGLTDAHRAAYRSTLRHAPCPVALA